MKKLFLLTGILFSVLILLGNFAVADERSPDQFTYVFHLYYDNGQLFADRDFEFKYDLVAEEFAPEMLTTQTPYKGEIVNVQNETETTFQFDPKQGNPKFAKGKILIKGPYFADAAKVNFYNAQNQKLLALNVSGSSFCNDDGTCNSDVGENYQNCPNDCPKPATPTPVPSIIPSAGISSLKLILIFAGAAVLIVVIWVVWAIIRKRKSGGGTLPPEVPIEVPPVPPIDQ